MAIAAVAFTSLYTNTQNSGANTETRSAKSQAKAKPASQCEWVERASTTPLLEKKLYSRRKTAAVQLRLLPPQLALPGESYVAAADYFGTTAASQARETRQQQQPSLKLVSFVQFGQKWHRWGP